MKLWREPCGCCWHLDLVPAGLFGFGRKDRTFYVVVFRRTIWLGRHY